MERGLIKDWMTENQVDQITLARMTGIKQSHLSDFLAGKKGLSWDNVVALAKETKIDLNALAGLKPPPMSVENIHPEGVEGTPPAITVGGKVKILIHGYVDATVVKGE
jgi:transcriptional regulator with XRE-family HTH domain